MSGYAFKNEVFNICCKGTARKPNIYHLQFKGKTVGKADYDFSGAREFEVKTTPEKFLDFDASHFPDAHQFSLKLKHPVLSMLNISRNRNKILFDYMVFLHSKDVYGWDINPVKAIVTFLNEAKAIGYSSWENDYSFFHENLCTSLEYEVPARGNLLSIHQKHFALLIGLWQKECDRLVQNVSAGKKRAKKL